MLVLSRIPSGDYNASARVIGLGGGAWIDVTGALGMGFPVVPLVRLSVGLFVLGGDIDQRLKITIASPHKAAMIAYKISTAVRSLIPIATSL